MNDLPLLIKNNLFVFSNRIISKIITFFVLLFLARMMSISEFGELTILLTLANIFMTLQDMGSSFIVVRETAKFSENKYRILFSTLFLKSLSGLICFPMMIISTYLLGYSNRVHEISVIFAVGMFFETSLLTIVKHFEGREKMNFSSFLIILERVVIIIILISLQKNFTILTSYGFAYLFSNTFVFVVGLVLALKNINNFPKAIDYKLSFKILKLSKYLLIFNLISILYTRLDVFIIERFLSFEQVGNYRATTQIIESIYFIPVSLSVSLLPLFSRLYSNSIEKLKLVFPLIIGKIFFLGIILSALLFYFSKDILQLVYSGKYLKGEVVFQWFAITVPLYFVNNILGNMLIAGGKEKLQLKSFIISAIVKGVLLIPLIRFSGLTGAVYCSIISESFMLLFQSIYVRKLNFTIFQFKKELVSIVLILVLIFILLLEVNFYFVITSLSVIIFFFVYDIYKKIMTAYALQ